MMSDDEWVEPETHPLWEYPAYPRSAVHTLMNFDLTSPVPSTTVRTSGTIDLISDQLSSDGGSKGRQCCNAVVVWMDYQLLEQYRSTTGLVKVCAIGVYTSDVCTYCKQYCVGYGKTCL